MQSSEFRDLAVWRMRWDREVGVVEREHKNVSEVELGIKAQTGAGIRAGLLALGDSEFPAEETVRLLAGPIRHAHENHAFVVFLGRNNEAGAWFWFGVNVVREMAPDDFASRGFRPPAHQVFSNSNRLLRTVPPLALGADFLS